MSQNMLSSSKGVSAGCRTLSAQPFPICQLVTVPVQSQPGTVPICQPHTVPTSQHDTVPTCQNHTVPTSCQLGTVPSTKT